MEEISCRQKSWEVWLKEGDRNIRFLHKIANGHYKRNLLARIKISGMWLTEEEDIKEGVARAF